MASFNYQEMQNQQKQQNNSTNGNQRPRMTYFNLKADGEEAIVRFMYDSPDEFNLYTVHTMQVDGKWRKIDCLNTPYAQSNPCPLCTSGHKAQRKFFIKLIQYVRNENGTIVAVPKIWERSDKYADTLSNLFREYGNIKDLVFKVKRNGSSGDVKTSYDIMYANPNVYKPELYVNDPELFKNVDLFKIGIISTKTADEMEAILNPTAAKPAVAPTPVNTQPTEPAYNYSNPQYTQPTQPTQPVQPATDYNQPFGEPNKPKRIYTY